MLLAARYVLPVAAPHIEHGAVLVRDGKIVEIGELESLKAMHPEETVRDFGLAALMPGFVDLHTHLEYSAMRGLVDDLPYAQWKLQVMEKERALAPQDWEDAAMLGALEALRSGITTVADITDSGASLRAVSASGLRAFVYREIQTMDRKRIDAAMGAAEQDIADWRSSADDELITVGIAPHSAYSCHPELFRRVSDYAIATGTPVTTHLAGSRAEYEFVKYGSSTLAFEYRQKWGSDVPWLPTGVSPVQYVLQWGLMDVPELLAVHCTQIDDNDIDVIATKDVAVAFCPRCNAKLGMGVLPLRKLLYRGVRVGIGTDSPASNNTVDMFDEMRIGLLIQRAMDAHVQFHVARKFVKLATLDAARALRIEDTIGSLEPGKAADIIAVDLSYTHQLPTQYPYSTLVHAANQDNVVFTMVGGRVLYDSGEWNTLDVERLRLRAEELRVKLRA